jgi:hypothetical protein
MVLLSMYRFGTHRSAGAPEIGPKKQKGHHPLG